MRILMIIIFSFLMSPLHAGDLYSIYLTWDTGKIASTGFGYGYNLIWFTNQQFKTEPNTDQPRRMGSKKIFGPIIGTELGLTGYEYSAGIKFGKKNANANRTYLFTIFTGRSQNWINLQTNIKNFHYVFGLRFNHKYIDWGFKFHTDLDDDRMVSVQMGLGE